MIERVESSGKDGREGRGELWVLLVTEETAEKEE